ncbi:MAG: phosphoglucomutase/phosphomannomutase family protein [Acidobacteria bacterium]|nr:phosphoglucomutase/phosphomannomutase family protein [Acidobacteriota bacterium]
MPQIATSTDSIRFGTDGWRGVIADDFTFANVRLVARAIARYLLAHEDFHKGIFVGYDCRFLSDRFARTAAEEVTACGIPVRLAADYTPTPALAFAVRNRDAAGAVVITASHNPSAWNGVKFKGSYGGSAAPEIIKKIEAELPHAESFPGEKPSAATLEMADLVEPYLRRIENVVDFKAIAKRKFLLIADPLHGAARQYLARLLERNGIRCQEIHGQADPLFGGLHPEPIPPHTEEAQRFVVKTGADAGFATDGDADRVGAIDRSGQFIDSHQIFAILLQYLVEVRGMKGGVAKTFSTTKLVDKLAAKYSLPLYETPIGFKHIVDWMLATDILIGGEESGGIGIPSLGGPERDGILNAVLLAEAMAHYGKPLGDLVAELHSEFGPHFYGRVDLALQPGQKERAIQAASGNGVSPFAGFPLLRREDLDGIKMYLASGAWLLVRASGTEPLLRVYTEADSAETVREILARAEQFIRGL